MRLFPIKRWFRLRRIVTLIAIFAIVTTAIKMGGFFKYKTDLKYSFSNGKKTVVTNPYGSTNFLIGSFLKNKTPGNFSHCFFRYGDWENFNYTDEDISYSPELGDKSPYRVLYGVVEGLRYNSTEPNTVTYVTHITLEYLFHIVEIATRWDGLISVACFLPGSDAVLALKLLEKMCFCMEEMENVNVHFVYHSDHPPINEMSNVSNVASEESKANETIRNATSSSLPFTKYNDNNSNNINNNKISSEICYVSPETLKNSYRCRKNLVYPVNVARNVARYGSKSKFTLVSDVELFPSQNLVPEFLKMINRLKERNKNLGDHYFTKKRHVYVVPVFEVSEDEPDVPRTKVQLLDLYAKERAVYFHRYVCLHCQRFPGLQRWLQGKVHPRTKPGSIQPLLIVKREFPYHRWEPVFIGNNQEPLYSEVLTWEGQQDKMTQMHEMCLLDYRFVILNGAFLVHTPGMKRKRDRSNFNTVLNQGNQGNQKLIGNKSTKAPNTVKTLITNVPAGGIFNWRTEHMKRNAYLYQVITQDVMSKYRSNPRCRVH